MPIPAVMYPPNLKETFPGAKLEKPLAGATTFAARLVVRVATVNAASPSTAPKPPSRPASATGSQTAAPKISTVAEVTNTLTKANSAIGMGKPRPCPKN